MTTTTLAPQLKNPVRLGNPDDNFCFRLSLNNGSRRFNEVYVFVNTPNLGSLQTMLLASQFSEYSIADWTLTQHYQAQHHAGKGRKCGHCSCFTGDHDKPFRCWVQLPTGLPDHTHARSSHDACPNFTPATDCDF